VLVLHCCRSCAVAAPAAARDQRPCRAPRGEEPPDTESASGTSAAKHTRLSSAQHTAPEFYSGTAFEAGGG
jgi:hypothetical protein